MAQNITFTKKEFDYFKQVIASGVIENNKDFLGRITEGAVCCDLTITTETPTGENKQYCYGNGFCMEANIYLLGKNAGYGEINGMPYDNVDGFVVHLKDTYKETLKEIQTQLSAIININSELKTGLTETEVTWDKI